MTPVLYVSMKALNTAIRTLAGVLSRLDSKATTYYRAPWASVHIRLESSVVTEPLVFDFPVDLAVSRPEAQASLLCTLRGSKPDTIKLWPFIFGEEGGSEPTNANTYGSEDIFGASSIPCITISHSATSTPTTFMGIDSKPLHTALLMTGLRPPLRPWAPIAMPFLHSFSSSVALSNCVVDSFGVMFPLDMSELLNQGAVSATDLRGGAIGLYDSHCTLSKTLLQNNVAREGGGVFSLGGVLIVNGSVLVKNRASHRGGGLSLSGGVPRISGSTVSHNVVGGNSVWWPEARVAEDRALSGGGGVFCFGVTASFFTAKETSFSHNQVKTRRTLASDVGGGLALSYCNFEFLQVSIVGNRVGPLMNGGTATQDGGGMHVFRGEGAFSNVSLASNFAATHGGGAVFEECGAVTLSATWLSGNVAQEGGGGALLLRNAVEALTLSLSMVEDNHAISGDGGGVNLAAAEITKAHALIALFDTIILKNTAMKGGGGGVYGFNVLGLPNLLAPLNDTTNAAAYGDFYATNPRLLQIPYDTKLELSFDAEFGQHDMTIRVLDEAHQVVSTFTGIASLIYKQLLDHGGRAVEAPLASPFSISLQQGIGSLEGMSFPLPPGFVIVSIFQLDTGISRIFSENFTTTLLGCPPGYYLPGEQATTCLPCAAGTKSVVRPTEICDDCQHEAKLWTCSSCSPGSYSSSPASTECSSCSAGRYSPTSGATECSACPSGTYSPTEASSCTPCEPGSFAPASSSAECLLCRPGTFSPSAGATECSQCPEELFSGLGWTECLRCPAGTSCGDGQLRLVNGWWLNPATLSAHSLPRHPLADSMTNAVIAKCYSSLDYEAIAVARGSQNAESLLVQCGAVTACHKEVLEVLWNDTGAIPGLAMSEVFGIVPSTQLLPCKDAGACESRCDGSIMGCSEGHRG